MCGIVGAHNGAAKVDVSTQLASRQGLLAVPVITLCSLLNASSRLSLGICLSVSKHKPVTQSLREVTVIVQNELECIGDMVEHGRAVSAGSCR